MKKFLNTTTDGFTLVEFIVIMSIFAIMVGVAVFNFTGFRSNVITENLAHDIAITLRNVQAGGGAAQSIDSPDNEQRRGIYFRPLSEPLREMILFIDQDNDGRYSEGETLDIIAIQSNDYIKNIGWTSLEGQDNKIDFEGISSISDDLSITFGRFSTAPYFSPPSESGDYLVITVGNDSDNSRNRYVVVSGLGQISVY